MISYMEVEMKFPLPEGALLGEKLSAWGVVGYEDLHEEDHYFNAPDRDFAKTDEALRLRRVGPDNFLTYKGPKVDTQTKTRVEFEVSLAPGDEAAETMMQLLTRLGYRPVAVVEKTRRVFQTKRDGFDLEVCLDDVKGLGRFVELEILAPENRLDQARRTVQSVAAELDLTTSERRSYLELLLDRQKTS
jgi:adenylate cyclase, class 2